MNRRIAILAVAASTLLLMGLSAGQAVAAGDDDIPGIGIGLGATSGVVDSQTDPVDVYSVKLFADEPVSLLVSESSPQGYVYVDLIAPGVKSIRDDYSSLVKLCTRNEIGDSLTDHADYTPAKDGVYHIKVITYSPGVPYVLTLSGSAEVPPTPSYLRLRTSATKVKKGRSVALSAKLVDVSSTLIPNYSATLFRSYDGHSWAKVTALSSTTGEYSKKARITRKTWFKMMFGGDATWSSCSSRSVVLVLR